MKSRDERPRAERARRSSVLATRVASVEQFCEMRVTMNDASVKALSGDAGASARDDKLDDDDDARSE